MNMNAHWLDTAFAFDPHAGVNGEGFEAWVNDVFESLPESCKGKRQPELSRQALNQILVNLLMGYHAGVPIAYSRRTKAYSRPKRYGLDFYSYRRIIPLVDALEARGFIETAKGFNFRHHRRKSRLWATGELMELLKEGTYQTFRNPPAEVIQLKNTDKALIDYTESDFTDSSRHNLSLYNEFISGHMVDYSIIERDTKGYTLSMSNSISIGNSINPSANLFITGNNKGFDEIKSLTQSNSLNFLCLHRVFNNGTFQQGGRFYGSHHQGLSKAERKTIRINGEPSVELDFSGFQVRALYHQEGLKYTGDPYGDTVNGTRDIYKTVQLIALNSASERQAVKAVRGNIGSEALKYLDRIKADHTPISRHFFTGAGCRLQNTESKITEYVILEMLSEDVPCLPVHDSYIVPKSAESLLKTTMEIAYERYVGGQPVIH